MHRMSGTREPTLPLCPFNSRNFGSVDALDPIKIGLVCNQIRVEIFARRGLDDHSRWIVIDKPPLSSGNQRGVAELRISTAIDLVYDVQTGCLPGCRVPGEADPSSMRPIACLHRN